MTHYTLCSHHVPRRRAATADDLEEIYKGLTGEKSVHLADYPSLVVPAQAGTSL